MEDYLEAARRKYAAIIEESGLDAALTELHNELRLRELEVFGEDGYRKERFDRVNGLRRLQRELWSQMFDARAKHASHP